MKKTENGMVRETNKVRVWHETDRWRVNKIRKEGLEPLRHLLPFEYTATEKIAEKYLPKQLNRPVIFAYLSKKHRWNAYVTFDVNPTKVYAGDMKLAGKFWDVVESFPINWTKDKKEKVERIAFQYCKSVMKFSKYLRKKPYPYPEVIIPFKIPPEKLVVK